MAVLAAVKASEDRDPQRLRSTAALLLRGVGFDGVAVGARGRHGWCLGDVMLVRIGVVDLGGWILKWPKTDEKL